MSWLSELEREFRYECPSCGYVSVYKLKQHDYDYTQPQKCIECGEQAKYVGFKTLKLGMRTKVAIERNGRKGYMHTDGKGGVRYTSASKEHYMETGDVRPCYTREYAEHLQKTGQGHLLEETKRDKIIADRERNKELAKKARPVLVEATNEDAV